VADKLIREGLGKAWEGDGQHRELLMGVENVRRGMATEGYRWYSAWSYYQKLKGSAYILPFKRWTVLTDILHCVAIRLVERPPRNPLRIANRSKRDSGSRLVVRGGSSRNLSNSSAIGGFLRTGGIPL
jgi:hypothetical protein